MKNLWCEIVSLVIGVRLLLVRFSDDDDDDGVERKLVNGRRTCDIALLVTHSFEWCVVFHTLLHLITAPDCDVLFHYRSILCVCVCMAINQFVCE